MNRRDFLTNGGIALGAASALPLLPGCSTTSSGLAIPNDRKLYFVSGRNGEKETFWVIDNINRAPILGPRVAALQSKLHHHGATIDGVTPDDLIGNQGQGGAGSSPTPQPTNPPLVTIVTETAYSNVTVISVPNASMQTYSGFTGWGDAPLPPANYYSSPKYGFINHTASCVASGILGIKAVAGDIMNALNSLKNMAANYPKLFTPGTGAIAAYAAGEIGAMDFILAVIAVLGAGDLMIVLGAAAVTLAAVYLAIYCAAGG